MGRQILRMKNIKKSFYGVTVLHGIDFNLEEGSIHALVGENGAGKSTLMKILLGIHKKDFGTIELEGQEVEFANPGEALKHSISMIHQEICLVPTLDVAENIWLGRENQFSKHGYINIKARYKETERFLKDLDIDINPREKVKNLSVAQMQLVELCRSVSYNSKVIIMDEPTSALASKEIDLLFRIIRRLKAQGVAVIFISHKLNEIIEICDDVTVMRDGHLVCAKKVEEVNEEKLIEWIAGRRMENIYPKTEKKIGETLLEVRHLQKEGVFEDINFDVKAGEIVAFSGLMGAGRTEIMRGLYGLDSIDGGEVRIAGKKVSIRSPKDSVNNGIGMVTEDRLNSGSIATMSVMENSTLPSLSGICKLFGYFSPSDERRLFSSVSERMSIKFNSPSDLIRQLSGGNQQKVIISRWILKHLKIIIMDEPTRGIDVGAKQEVYKIISDLAKQGMGVILISSELPEIMGLSDRICVVRNGRIVHRTRPSDTSQEELMSYAFGIQATL